MATTLRDVADRAQVSVRTVSNVLGGYEHVSARMRARVQTAIEELDYHPNPVARALRTGRSGVLSLVVPEINQPYFSELAAAVIDAAAAYGYRVAIDQTGNEPERERQLLTGQDPSVLVDGLIFASSVTEAELQEMRASMRTPVVLLGENRAGGHFDHVAIDNRRAAVDAVAHLAGIGRTTIAAIGVQPDTEFETPRMRALGYADALEAAGLRARDGYLLSTSSSSRPEGYAAAQALLALDPRPDAIFCFSDLLAIGAMRAVFDAGLRVPEDIAVIGIDNIQEGRYSRPSLSTIALDMSFAAAKAIHQLVQRIEDPSVEPEEIVAPHRLVVRESTGGGADA